MFKYLTRVMQLQQSSRDDKNLKGNVGSFKTTPLEKNFLVFIKMQSYVLFSYYC